MKTPDFSCERLSQVLSWILLSCSHGDEVPHLGQPINDYPDLGEAIRFRESHNEIHRNSLPRLVRDVQGLQKTVLLLVTGLVPLANITTPDIVLDIFVHLGPEEVLLQEFHCLELPKMPCDPRVMVVTQDLQSEARITGDDIQTLIGENPT